MERKGERTLLLTTRGLGDLLRIGYQNRPRLFDLNIVLPELLYSEAAEIPERLDAAGEKSCAPELSRRDWLLQVERFTVARSVNHLVQIGLVLGVDCVRKFSPFF